MRDIIKEIREAEGTNNKLRILEYHKDNEQLQRVLKMTYDKVSFTYGVTMKSVNSFVCVNEDFSTITLKEALDSIESNLCTRKVTGHAALKLVTDLLLKVDVDDSPIIEGIISRDLDIKLGRTSINKVFKKLIVKPAYMRCSLKDKLSKITYPAISDKKEDGTYRSVISDSSSISTMSRPGELDNFKKFQEKTKTLQDGVLIGEFLIRSLPGSINRQKANGLINSDTEQDDMYFSVWDYLTLEEFAEGKSSTHYIDRKNKAKQIVEELGDDCIQMVEYKIVNSYEEALEHYSELIEKGFEGTVLKNMNTPFKDGTSTSQIKMKEEAVAEFRVVGFQEGTKGLTGSLGAILIESECGQVKSKFSSFEHSVGQEIWDNQDKYMNGIVSVKYNGVTKARGNDFYALMYGKFDSWRIGEKDVADDLEYIKNALK